MEQPNIEVREEFESIDLWRLWQEGNPWVFDPEVPRAMAASIKDRGLTEPISNHYFAPDLVAVHPPNYRESIIAGGLISRHRAVLAELAHQGRTDPDLTRSTSRGYAPEAITAFALRLRGRYSRFIGSEFCTTSEERRAILPIEHQDLQRLTFPNDLFDWVLSNDVFEHVPNLDECLREVCRVLRPGGFLISTFPFAYQSLEGVVKARRVGESVEYLAEPEYHGNPMNPDEGSLVFEIPGWDLIARSLRAGFKHSSFVFCCSNKFGIVGHDLAGVFVFAARK